MKFLTTWLLLFSLTAQAGLNVCPRMPVTAGSAGQFVSAISASGAVTLATPSATVVTAPPTQQRFTSGTSQTYNKDYTFVITSGSATVGATYTNNAITYTVYATVASATQVVMSGSGAPAASGTLTKASGTGDSTLTFSQVLAPLYLHVRLVGGGSGGSGSSPLTSGSNGGVGGTTSFGTSLLSATGGGATGSTLVGGAGGTATITAPAYGSAFTGTRGNDADNNSNSVVGDRGTTGGVSGFGGAGAACSENSAGLAAPANSGGGGGGAGSGNSATTLSGGAGGAGGFIDAFVPSPSATYTYSVGAAGTAGAAGSGGNVGGAGGAGYIEVTEFYQ